MKKMSFACGTILLLAMFSCEKSSTKDDLAIDPVKKSLNPLDHEIYDPGVEDQYSEMRDGIIAVFDGTNPGGRTDINRAIWLYEGALSTLHAVDEHDDGDSVVRTLREFVFNLSDDEILDEDFKNEFTTDYDQVQTHLENNNNQSYSSTDVQFISLDGQQLHLKVVTSFHLNPSKIITTGPNVPPASVDRYGGADAICGQINGGGAWRHVQKQVRAVVPSRAGASMANVVWYSSEVNVTSNRHINGDFLFGQPNALHFPYPAAMLDCVTAAMQDDFAQTIVNTIYGRWGLSALHKTVRNLMVHKHNSGHASALWEYQFEEGDYFIWTIGPVLGPQHLWVDM